jgi:hypothetical protein
MATKLVNEFLMRFQSLAGLRVLPWWALSRQMKKPPGGIVGQEQNKVCKFSKNGIVKQWDFLLGFVDVSTCQTTLSCKNNVYLLR